MMKKITVYVVHAFVDGKRGGNPAGVVLNADGLSNEEKQQVAAKAGFSETAFVSHSDRADFKVDFFTPVAQIADCGHATVATFCYLKQIGLIKGNQSSKEITTGVRCIQIQDDLTFMEQMVPVFTSLSEVHSNINHEAVLSAIGLESDDSFPDLKPVIADNGDKGLIVPLKDENSLLKIDPNFSEIKKICKELQVFDFYAFSPDTRMKGYDAGVRMFAPLIGIPEEAATGMSAGRLACYLFEFFDVKKDKMVIEQGFLMNPPSPSLLYAKLDIQDDRIRGVRVGGKAVVKESFVITVD